MFERTKAFRKAAVFFNSLTESVFLERFSENRNYIACSRKYRGIQTVLSELYNTVEVMNNAE